MSTTITAKNGRKIGYISDSESEQDYFIVNNRKVAQHEVYADKSLRDSFNQSITSTNIDMRDNDGTSN